MTSASPCSLVFISELSIDDSVQPNPNDIPSSLEDPSLKLDDLELRQLLRRYTAGVIRATRLIHQPYGIALYRTEAEALAACKTIVPNDSNQKPMRLRMLERPIPPPPPSVYQSHLIIDGKSISKDLLAETRGLQMVYRGCQLPKWCRSTLGEVDCPFGFSCKFLHKREFQKTIHRRRVEIQTFIKEQCEILSNKSILNVNEWRFDLPLSLFSGTTISLNASDCAMILQCNTLEADTYSNLLNDITQRAEKALRSTGMVGPYFVGLDVPHGAPWDWALYDEGETFNRLRKECPFPTNGAPNSEERDAYSQKLLRYLNELNQWGDGGIGPLSAGFRSLGISKKTRPYLEELVSSSQSSSDSNSLVVVLLPWYRISHLMDEVEIYVRDNKIIAISQRRYQGRLMDTYQRNGMNHSKWESREDLHADPAGLEFEAKLIQTEEIIQNGVNDMTSFWRAKGFSSEESHSITACFNMVVDQKTMTARVISAKPFVSAMEKNPTLALQESSKKIQWTFKEIYGLSIFTRSQLKKLV